MKKYRDVLNKTVPRAYDPHRKVLHTEGRTELLVAISLGGGIIMTVLLLGPVSTGMGNRSWVYHIGI